MRKLKSLVDRTKRGGSPKEGPRVKDLRAVPKSAQEPLAPNSLADDGNATIDRSVTSSAGQDKTMVASSGNAGFSFTTSGLWQNAVTNVKMSRDWESFKRCIKFDDETGDVAAGLGTGHNQLQLLESKLKQVIAQHDESTERGKVFNAICEKVLSVLGALNAAGGAAAAFNPYAALGWSTIQWMVSAAQTYKSVRRLCWENIPRLAILVSKYQVVEDVYCSSSGMPKTKQYLEEALENLYTALLTYQVKMVMYVSSLQERLKAPFIPESESLPRRMLVEIQQLEEHVTKQTAMSHGELVTSTFNQLSTSLNDLRNSLKQYVDMIERLSAGLEQVSRAVESSYRSKILSWLSPDLYGDRHMSFSRNVSPGTTDWLMIHDQYRQWVDTDGKSGLWLYGSMGTGKSYLAHAVIEDRKKAGQQLGPCFPMAYFYCDGANQGGGTSDTLDTERFLACIVKQVAMTVHDRKLPEAIIELYESYHQQISRPTADQCLGLLSELSNRFSTLTLILDGVDECQLEVQQSLLDTLEHIYTRSKTPIKMFISSRDQGDVRRLTKSWITGKIDVVKHNTKAINQMISTKVLTCSQSEPWKSRCYCFDAGENQSQAVIDTLQANAGGMFRWAQMALDYLHRSGSPSHMAERLDEIERLPKLFDLYETIYEDFMSEAGPMIAKVIDTALVFLLHGIFEGDLFPDEYMLLVLQGCAIAHAAFVNNGYPGKQARVVSYQPTELVDLCPSFLVVQYPGTEDSSTEGDSEERFDGLSLDETYPPIRFPHFSVREFLLERHADKYSERAGNAFMASLCIGVLRHDEPSDDRPNFELYALNYWLNHAALELYARCRPEIRQRHISDEIKVAYEQELDTILPAVGLSEGFKNCHLLWHQLFSAKMQGGLSMWAFSVPGTALYAQIILGKDLAVTDHRPLSSASSQDQEKASPPPIPPLSFAAAWGRLKTTEWLLQYLVAGDMKASTCTEALQNVQSGVYGSTPFVEKECLVRIAELLLNNGAEIELWFLYHIMTHDTSVHMEALSQVVINRGILYLIDERDATLIDILLGNTHISGHTEKTLRFLPLFFEHGFGSTYRNRWLQLAAGASTLSVLTLLVENNSDPLAFDVDGRTSVDIARTRVEQDAQKIITHHDVNISYHQTLVWERDRENLLYLESVSARITKNYPMQGCKSLDELQECKRVEVSHRQHDQHRFEPGCSSYWSVYEKHEFPKLIAYFGRDFDAIAAFMTRKTAHMLKNLYHRELLKGNAELEKAAMIAETMRDRGEPRGILPLSVARSERK